MREWLRGLGPLASLGEQMDAHGEQLVASIAAWAVSPAGRATRRRLPSGLEVADFLQELVLRMLSRRSGGKVGEAYLQTAAMNGVRSELRSAYRQRRRAYPEDEAARERIEPAVDADVQAQAGPDVQGILAACLRPESYALLQALAFDDLTEEALSARHGVDTRTIRRWSKELREFLRRHSELAGFAPASG